MPKYKPMPPLERLNELFEVVDIPESQFGIQSGLVRKINTSNTKKGDVAGCLITNNKDKKRKDWAVKIDGNRYYVSRIVYYIITQVNPDNLTIDHINRNPLDNNVKNLQLVDPVIQANNRKKFVTNTSGAVGVSWDKSNNKWVVRFLHKGPTQHLGYYICKREAAYIYNQKVLYYGLDKVGKPLNDLNAIKCNCLACKNSPT
jgi:hypothetical protein